MTIEPKLYTPPLFLKQGLLMTLYIAFGANRKWEKTIKEPEPPYFSQIFTGAQDIPIFGRVAIPKNPKGTIIGTYGITGTLENQWILRILGRKAFAAGYGVVLFDWRGHGKTGQLSPTLLSDGLYEGKDFIKITAQAKQMGCPSPFWFTGYSLGGQLALWGIKETENIPLELGLDESEIGGAAVICPNLDSDRTLSFLVNDFWGKYLEKAIANGLKQLAWDIYHHHPKDIDPVAIERIKSIREFDRELIIKSLGFSSVEEYYAASCPLPLLKDLKKPTLILYAADDPLFAPSIIPDLQIACEDNSLIDLRITRYGGHVGYISSRSCQRLHQDPDCWWGWNRILEWINNNE
ncbi:alpha/beta hydrolase [Gloeothece citriformis PCC 7424]|uniref:Alpha/beta hydrolase n=1 Tax=Gloeothece citriformis (strain PCC 7424) TaxID=65393 RepID=B7KAY1_GLOC7|nr:alpha/beta fold hydrolase [Gloeothece citriformis]ACK70091.1 alpha/beta hydrolase [Gloeothece citriformis PCC 7424]